MKKIPIREATEKELREFATGTLGISIKATAKLETVRARINAAWDKDEITVADAEPEKESEDRAIPQAPTPITEAQKPPAEDMVRLIIHVTEEAGGSDPIQLGVNGKIMLVPRGKEVEIPKRFYEVLCHAITHKYESMPDGGMDPIPREVSLYPFQRVA